MRFFKKVATASAVAVSLLLTSCTVGTGVFSSDKKSVATNLFTGLPGSNNEVLAVKFDDTRFAHPQQGIEGADVVFVTQVEAGLTRLLAIYSSHYPELIGPIRSARISDIDILAQFGRVGFAYSGSQTKMRSILASANLINLSAERNPASIFPQDPNRVAPYSMMLHPGLLLDKADSLAKPRDIGIQHGTAPDKNSRAITSAIIRWPNAKYEARWNSTSKRFDLWHDGAPNINVSGQQLGSPMMVIQMVEIHPSQFGDKFGGITPKSTVVGNGKAYLLRDGRVIEAFWSRPTADGPTSWTLPDGKTAYFAKGQVWFFLTDKEPEFTFANADPSQSSRS